MTRPSHQAEADINQKIVQYYPASQTAEILGLPPSPRGDSVHSQQLLQVQAEELLDQALVLLTERLLEGVSALHLHCGWPLRHLAFARVHCADCWDTKLADGPPSATRVVGSHVTRPWAPSVANPVVTAETQMEIARRTASDGVIYSAAKGRWEDVMDRAESGIREVMCQSSALLLLLLCLCSKSCTNRDHISVSPKLSTSVMD